MKIESSRKTCAGRTNIHCNSLSSWRSQKVLKLVITEQGLLPSLGRSVKINNFVNNFQKLRLISCSFSTIFSYSWYFLAYYYFPLLLPLDLWQKNAHYIKKIKVVDKTKGQIMPSNNSATSQGRMTVTAAAAVHQLPSPIWTDYFIIGS